MIADAEIGNADVVELLDLRAFLAVARSGSFTAAAVELGYTQSAVSQQVAALETAVGRTLLTRRPVAVTPAGRRLAEHAAHIVLRLDVARSELAMDPDEQGVLRMAVTPLAGISLAGSLRTIRSGRPALEIVLATADPRAAAADVASGEADLAVVDGIVDADHPLALADAGLLASFPISELPLAVALPSDHPLANRWSLDLDTLVDARFLDAPAITTPVGRLPGRTRPSTPSRFTYTGTDLSMLVALVAADHGIALLPADAGLGTAPGVRLVPISGTGLVHRTEMLVLKNAVDLHRQTIDLLRA